MNLNKVTLIGHLAANPRPQTLASGDKIASITVITLRDGKHLENDVSVYTTELHEVVAYGRLGQIISKYLKTGDRVYLEGRLRKAKGEEGQKNAKWKTEIVASQMIMLGKESHAGGQDERVS